MSSVDQLINANENYSAPRGLGARPTRRVAIVTCMDCRIDPLAAFGLELGEAHVIRNAGGLVTDDVLRSLAISQRALGTDEIMLVHHTTCGLQGFDDAEFRSRLSADGQTPGWDVPGFTDPFDDTRTSVSRVQATPWFAGEVRGFVYDVETGRLSEV